MKEEVGFVLLQCGQEGPFRFPVLKWLKYSVTLLHTKETECLVLKHSCCSKDSENACILE